MNNCEATFICVDEQTECQFYKPTSERISDCIYCGIQMIEEENHNVIIDVCHSYDAKLQIFETIILEKSEELEAEDEYEERAGDDWELRYICDCENGDCDYYERDESSIEGDCVNLVNTNICASVQMRLETLWGKDGPPPRME